MTRTPRLLVLSAAVMAATLALAAAAAAHGSPPAGAASVVAATTATTGPTGPAAPDRPLTATLSACHSDVVPADRYAVFASQMVAADVPGTITMEVDFQLQVRSGGSASFAPVAATGFGQWIASQPGVGIFSYSHEVTGLPAPAAVRVFVRARWIGRRRRVLERSTALSPSCVETALTPDLEISRVRRARGGTAAESEYDVWVRNAGNAAAGPFQVSLEIGSTSASPATVPGLAAGAAQAVQLSGPRCTSGQTLTAVVDAAGAISEPANSRRTLSIACP